MMLFNVRGGRWAVHAIARVIRLFGFGRDVDLCCKTLLLDLCGLKIKYEPRRQEAPAHSFEVSRLASSQSQPYVKHK